MEFYLVIIGIGGLIYVHNLLSDSRVSTEVKKVKEKIIRETSQEAAKVIDAAFLKVKEKEVLLKAKTKDFERTVKKKNEELERFFNKTDLFLKKREKLIDDRDQAFKSSFIDGRLWLMSLIKKVDLNEAEFEKQKLLKKKNPAVKTAEKVKALKKQSNEWKRKFILLENHLQSFKEYFPALEEYEEQILNEEIEFELSKEGKTLNDKTDRVKTFLSKEEYEKLGASKRNQLALDRYLNRNHSKQGIGKLYERQIGQLFEKQGYSVDFFGIKNGLEDLGRDLIVKKDGLTIIIQAKCWSKKKTIHEKHIFQLYGTTIQYMMDNPFEKKVQPKFITSTSLSPVAQKAADLLGIKIMKVDLDKTLPMIKCNIGKGGAKIYHLPIDQQYDRVKIEYNKGEFYAKSVSEAEKKGFVRAKRFKLVS